MNAIYELLKNGAKNYSVRVVDEINSTNSYLKNNAENLKDGAVIIAKKQTAGRGRLGRSFISEKGGLYISLLIKPSLCAEKSLFITTTTAVAVARAIETVSDKKTGIKWVNDLFIDGKKVCGILVEGAANQKTGLLDYAVIGIGVNVYEPESGFDAEIKDIAGAVFGKNNDNGNITRLAAEILNQLSDLLAEPHSKEVLNEYRNRSVVIGKKVDIIKDGNTASATVIDIDNDAAIILELSNGEVIKKISGEISIRL